MKTQEPISIGLCLQVMIDTIGQDCLLDYFAAPSPTEYATQKQKFERLKKREKFDPTTIKNLKDFSKFIKEWSDWLIGDGYANSFTMNYVDRFLVNFTEAAYKQIPVGNILYVSTYSICYVIWETYKELLKQNKNQPQNDLIRSTLSIFDFFDSDSEYLKEGTIFKKIFWYLDQFITDKPKLFTELSQFLSDNYEKKTGHELERQIYRWINEEQKPSWNIVKWICSEDFVPSKELFKKTVGFTDKENEPAELWKFFRQRFLFAYFINNFFYSLENKQKLITKEQKEYLISGIRYMFRAAYFSDSPSKSDMVSEMNFVFHSLYNTFSSNIAEDGIKTYLEKFIPWLIHSNPAVNFGINKIFEQEAEAFNEK